LIPPPESVSPAAVESPTDVPVIVPLAPALVAVAGAVADVGGVSPGQRTLVARHADFWRFDVGRGADAVPFDLVFPIGALTPAGRTLAAILLATLRRSPALTRAAVVAADRDGPGAVVAGLARALQTVLTPDELAAEAARREELLRRCIAHLGAVVGQSDDRPEPPARQAQALARYDVGRRRAEAREVARQRALMEATREARRLIASGVDLGPPT
jgi:hypothetical protein